MPAARKSSKSKRPATGSIRAGVGGWTYEPWRGNFFPDGLVQHRELDYASRHLTSIEVNGTFYRAQKPATYAKWRSETPQGFVFSLKAPRYATVRKVLADAGKSINAFVRGGIVELGDRLGPVNWQFAPTKHFDAEDFGAFLDLLPRAVDGVGLRHVVEVRHASFACEEYVALASRHRVATVFADSPDYPSFADLTGDFAYARLMSSKASAKTGYAPAALKAWTRRAHVWAAGGDPPDLPRILPPGPASTPRDVFIYFINGAKERAPHAAMALLKQLDNGTR